MHEDPLYAIQKQEMKARESIMNNPIEMRNIIQEVEEDYLKMHKMKKEDSREEK